MMKTSVERGVIDGIQCINFKKASEEAKEEIVLISMYEYEDVERQLVNNGFHYVFSMTHFLRRLYNFIPKRMNCIDYKWVKPFNFYESPYPDLINIHNREEFIFQRNKTVADIDFNWNDQIKLLHIFSKIPLLAWESNASCGLRYYYDNRFFPKGCAHALYFMLQKLRPKRIIEVGSGFSTAVILDTNDRCFNNDMEIVCIEPNPQRLKSLLTPVDNICIYEKELQNMPIEFFEHLEKDDILFVDSSHIVKFDSDVNYIFFELLPRLKSGVYIHFHDIFYPFIYPKKWIYEGRSYNEMYLLRAFLMHNTKYKIKLFPDMLVKKGNQEAIELFNNVNDFDNHSLWIQKQ